MTLKLSSLRADTAADAGGEWIDSLAFPGVRWQLRSLNYPPFVIALDQVTQRLARQHRGKAVDPAIMSVEVGALQAKHLLLGWEGLDVPWTAATAAETLADPGFREAVRDIENCATLVARARLEYLEETGKNSGPRSATP